MRLNRSNLGFFLLEGFFWAAYCALFGFTVTILREYGFSAEVCGAVTTLQGIVLMVIQPVYGYLVDRMVTPKQGFIAIMVVGVTLALPLPWVFGQGVWAVVPYITLLSLFVYSAGAVLDAWAVGVINRTRGMDYAICRGGGSVFYAVMALFAGNLIAPLGVQSLFVLHIVLGVCTIGVALVMIDSSKLEESELRAPAAHRQKASFLKASKLLLGNRDYVVFTLCMCLFNFGTRVYSTYMPLVIENVGGNSSHFGVSLFISALGEVIFMLLASRMLLRGFAPAYLYLTAVCILSLRFFIMGFTQSLWVLLLTQVIQAVGFGLNLRMNSEYLVHTAPPGYEGMALMLSSSISVGVGVVFGNFVGGYIIEWLGVQSYVLICAASMACIIPVFLPTVLREHRTRREQKRQYLLHNCAVAPQPDATEE